MRDSQNAIVDLLYDGIVHDGAWDQACAALARLLDAEMVVLQTRDDRNAVTALARYGLSDRALALYGAEFAPHDIYITRGIRRPGIVLAHSHEFLSDHDIETSYIYNELMRSEVGTFHMVGVAARIDLPEARGAFALGIHRAREAGPFDETASLLLRPLVPHLQRAAEARHSLALARASASAGWHALDHASLAVLWLDARGCLRKANASGQALLETRRGLALGRNDTLHATHREAATVLATALGAALAGADPRPFALERDDAPALQLQILRACDATQGASLVLLVADPAAPSAADPATLARLLGLSRTEAELALHLAQGEGLGSFRDARGIAASTAKTLLARANAKTATDGQRGLASLVRRGLAGLTRV